MSKFQKGFSLVELAVVLAIIGILSMGALLTLSGQRDAVKVTDSKNRLLQIKKSLLSFELVNRYLPCPDINGDGDEDRTNGACSRSYGAAPYQDLGLTQLDVQDAYGVEIRYAVNSGATTLSNMQDVDHSASYFCQTGCDYTSTFVPFRLTTPPIAGNLGAGNYTICNNAAATCVTGLASDQHMADGLSVILVAYNANGRQLTPSCTGLSNRETENCDLDLLYWDYYVNKDLQNYYDDQILGISGYEIKQELLKNDATIFNTASNSNSNTQNNLLIAPPPPPTNPTNTVAGDYTGSSDYNPPNGNFDDSLKIDGNLDAALDLNNGDNELTVTGDQNYALVSGSGNDNLYIAGDAKSSISTGSGNDYLTILGNLSSVASVDMGANDDFFYIVGDVDGSVDLGSGDDTFRVDGDLNHTVYGGAGTDIIYVNKTPADWTSSGQASYLNGFERIRFNDGTAQDI
ncbi:type II secretion system protein [Thiosulfativibrio zosterae]|uniref:Prepilin-type N-terminal cleavage/methylation domain-containing protein n=1 Tax=Thiosulfativibrio zosterae TaxID=2675053 RepID=A0A6F8PL43_9GAMM|nr:type II secretion system protein [Thiosulfativibrio zosterae]BBP42822.1 hypothetical protein THMIRHAT_05680 [Thiosulfativibrio zosterae]